MSITTVYYIRLPRSLSFLLLIDLYVLLYRGFSKIARCKERILLLSLLLFVGNSKFDKNKWCGIALHEPGESASLLFTLSFIQNKRLFVKMLDKIQHSCYTQL